MNARVSVVIATRDRPEMLVRAVRAVHDQDYDGDVEVLVVFDQSAERDLAEVTAGPVRALTNSRSPGLAGARNTGILEASGDLVAFCDDDDEWHPGKLRAQVDLFERHPGATLAATGILIRTADGDHERIGPERVDLAGFARSRWPEVHPSTFVLRRAQLLGEIGLVDEDIPHSYGEDYDLILRATRIGYAVTVREALVTIHWNRPSFFADRWAAIADGLEYLLAKHPELRADRIGRARIQGQIAFARAASGRRRAGLHWAFHAARGDVRQLRAYAALAVSCGVPAGRLVELVQARGKGL